MTGEELKQHVLGLLKPDDLELLLNLNFRRAFERGELLVATGERVERFYLLEEGLLRLDGDAGGEPRFLRPGQVMGTTASLIAPRPSDHHVSVAEDTIAITMTGAELDWLTEAEPAVAARVMRAIGAALAARNVGSPVGVSAQPAPAVRRPEPAPLSRLAEACHECRAALDAMGPAPEDGAAFWARERIPAVATAYRPVLRALAAMLDPAPPAERPAIVDAARRELDTVAGTSRLVERMGTRPTGSAAGWRGFNHIYRNVPEGDDALGLLTDAWLLTRPFAEAIRERRVIASERTTREILDRARPDRIVRLLSIGCGPARSLGDLLEEAGMADKISVTCVDDDQEALVHANNLLKGRAPRADITFRQANPADLTPDTVGYGGYDIVASIYTADNSDEAALGRIMFTAHRWMHAHAAFSLCVFGDAVPDWLLLEVLLHWKPKRYSQRELQDIIARSPFNQAQTEVAATPSGLNVFLRAVK
jgi:extracellular factor (EF) 3-hydroxypalmitic acid methyl ester biosynthesis protein